MASRNPFRRENGSQPEQTAEKSLPPTPPPPALSQETGSTSASSSMSQRQADREALEAEPDLPPPYTPGPASQGETTLEFGPARPFQPAPAPQFLTPQATGYSSQSGFQPPPRHPSIIRHSTGNMSPGLAPPGGLPPNRYAPPSNPPPSRGYAPPPGQPPAASNSGSGSTYPPPAGQPPRQSGGPAQANFDEEGRPTSSPTPGHPLLRNNRVLVYPKGYTCWKCSNTGFKAFDPTHPCRKCWERYSKPFEGPIVYAPWSSSYRNTGAPDSDTLQKPLPKFRPPTASVSGLYGPSSPGGHWGGVFGSPPGGGGMLSRGPSMSYAHAPPPGAVIVQPGDPRIGGRLCWRCDGLGTVPFLIFDEETCPICNGSGRTFP